MTGRGSLPVDGPVRVLTSARDLIACAWGKMISSVDDGERCPATAQRIMTFHHDGRSHEVRLCAHHVEMAKRYATPAPGTATDPSATPAPGTLPALLQATG